MRAREHLARASELRRRVREADDSVSEPELRQLCDDADRETDNVRLLGDLALAAFFEGSKPKQREDLRKRLADAVQRGEMHGYVGWLGELRGQEPPLAPFHWEIEFPEVFDRENPGFDAVVGNPPFAGKNTVAAANVAGYPDWLKQVHEGSHGNADLVAHFFRRAFGLLRTGGTSGLIATNTIAQGDTRSTGLRWICNNGGEIYGARRRVKWPGLAAVVVSMLHVHKGGFPGVKLLDGEAVDTTTAFLFHRGGHDDPARLKANAGKSFQGSIVLGMGFTFDDTDTKGVATPLAEMHRLIEEEPRNREVIFPYIGGEEVNTSPTHAHHRYVINFRDWPLRREAPEAQAPEARSPGCAGILPATGRRPAIVHAKGTLAHQERSAHRAEPASEGPSAIGERASDIPGQDLIAESPETCPTRTPASWDNRPVPQRASWKSATDEQRREWLRSGIVPLDYPEPVAADWPDLLAIVEERVRPERMKVNRKVRRDYWWRYGDRQPALYSSIGRLRQVPAISRVGQQAAFAFRPAGMVYAESLVVFPFDTFSAFCSLQSRPHEIWARFLGSSMKDDLRYTPSDCFETFPFPDGWNTHPDLERAGTDYYQYRANLMIRCDQGLTKTYNRYHDPDETDPEIARLRDLHAAMDRAVLDAYGWTDIPTDCEFLLDYEIEEEEWGTRKQPYRYRWPDEVRDEVLARLLELNAERARAEQRSGGGGIAGAASPGPRSRRPPAHPARNTPDTVPATRTLWDDDPLEGSSAGGNPDGIEA